MAALCHHSLLQPHEDYNYTYDLLLYVLLLYVFVAVACVVAGDADRKFLVRCSFDDPGDKQARERVFVMLELTCTIRTERNKQADEEDR